MASSPSGSCSVDGGRLDDDEEDEDDEDDEDGVVLFIDALRIRCFLFFFVVC
jgi:hypothetical protein